MAYVSTIKHTYELVVETFTGKYIRLTFDNLDDAQRLFLQFSSKLVTHKARLSRLQCIWSNIEHDRLRLATYEAPFYKYVLHVLAPFKQIGEHNV